MASSLARERSSSYPVEPFLQQFPQIQKAIWEIQGESTYREKYQREPKYLHQQLGSIFQKSLFDYVRALSISHDDLSREEKKIFHSLSVEYASETYQRTPQHKELIQPLHASELFSIHIFTNEGVLHPHAKRRAWKKVVARIVRIFIWDRCSPICPALAYEKRVAVLSDLLPDANTYFRSEDQKFLLKCLSGIQQDYPPPTPLPEASLLFQRMQISSCPKEQKQWIDLAMSMEAIDIAMQWQAKVGFDFSEEQLQQVFKRCLIETDRIDMLNQLFSKDLTLREEKALTSFFSQLKDRLKEEQIVMKAVVGEHERLTIKLLSCIQSSLSFLIFVLAITREKELLSVVSFLSATIKRELTRPDCSEETRGAALETAVKWHQKELIDEILSKKVPSKNRGCSAIFAAEKNRTELVKKLWDAKLIEPEDQNKILNWAAAHGNRDIVQLRLDSQVLVSPQVRKSALQIAKKHGHYDALQDLLGSWMPVIIDDYVNHSLKSSPK